MTMQRIRDQYRVPAKRGARVKFRGEQGTITQSLRTAAYLWVRMDNGERYLVHPTWEIEYL